MSCSSAFLVKETKMIDINEWLAGDDLAILQRSDHPAMMTAATFG